MGKIVLEAKKLNFGFAGTRKPLLNDLSFQFSCKNSPYAFIGKARAGKSTFLLLLGGFILPLSGDVQLNGKSILRNFSLKKKIGMLFQSAGSPVFDGKKRKKMFRRAGCGNRIAELLNREFAERNREFIEKNQKNASKKTKKELKSDLLYFILSKKLNVLLLDEPESGLSKKQLKEFPPLINNNKSAIKIIVTYNDDIFALCKTVVFINKGKIAKVYPVRNSAAFCGNL